MMDLYHLYYIIFYIYIFQYLKARCHGNQIICERQVQHGKKTGVFCQIFPDILDLFSQSFHHITALYVQMMDRYLIFRFLKGCCHGYQIICERQVWHGPKTGVFCRISPDILDRFLKSFHHMKALYVQTIDLYFFSQFCQLPSSNLEAYAVKTCNFCRHAPAILGRSSYVTLVFRNGWKIAILISAE